MAMSHRNGIAMARPRYSLSDICRMFVGCLHPARRRSIVLVEHASAKRQYASIVDKNITLVTHRVGMAMVLVMSMFRRTPQDTERNPTVYYVTLRRIVQGTRRPHMRRLKPSYNVHSAPLQRLRQLYCTCVWIRSRACPEPFAWPSVARP